MPVDSYGVGSSLIRGSNDFTADVVMVDGKPCAKVGREYRPNPRLSAVVSAESRAARSARARGRVRSSAAARRGAASTSRWSPSSTGPTSRPPARELVRQRGAGRAARRRGDVDRVEGRVLGQPARAVADDAASRSRRPPPRGRARPARDSAGVALDAPHVRGEPGEQRGVVARAGADVEHPLAAVELEQLAHARDHERLGDRLARADRQRRRCPTPRRRSARGTKRSRGTARIASSTRSSATCGRSCSSSRSRGSSLDGAYATVAPAAAQLVEGALGVARLDVDAADRRCCRRVTAKPSRSASSAVFLTQ